MEKDAFVKLITTWVVNAVVDLNDRRDLVNIKKYIPPEYQIFWPNNRQEAEIYGTQISDQVRETLTTYSLIMVARLNDREEVYYPYGGKRYDQFAETLEQIPTRTEVIAIYPFYK